MNLFQLIEMKQKSLVVRPAHSWISDVVIFSNTMMRDTELPQNISVHDSLLLTHSVYIPSWWLGTWSQPPHIYTHAFINNSEAENNLPFWDLAYIKQSHLKKEVISMPGLRTTPVFCFVTVHLQSNSQMAFCTFPGSEPRLSSREKAPGRALGTQSKVQFILECDQEDSVPSTARAETILAFLRLVPIKY